MDKAINEAIGEVLLKEFKQHTRKSCCKTQVDVKCYKDLIVNLEEGRKSTMLQSSVPDRKCERRDSIFEKNTVERILVKATLKNLIQDRNISKIID